MDNSVPKGGTNWSGHNTRSDIPYIRAALNQQIEQFSKISNEMKSYSGPTEADAAQLRQILERSFAESKTLNPPEVYRAFLDEQVNSHLEPGFFFSQKYNGQYMSSAISLVILSAALAEALANSFVATGLMISGREKLFPVFDRMDLSDKWTLGVTLFDISASIDNGNSIFERLSALVSLRNSFMHNKAEISRSDGLSRIKGSKNNLIRNDERGREEISKFGTLPDELFDLALSSVGEKSWTFFLRASSFRFEP